MFIRFLISWETLSVTWCRAAVNDTWQSTVPAGGAVYVKGLTAKTPLHIFLFRKQIMSLKHLMRFCGLAGMLCERAERRCKTRKQRPSRAGGGLAVDC